MRSFVSRAVRSFARAVGTSLYSRQLQYITVQPVGVGSNGTAPDRETECLIVDALEALRAVAPEIPATFRDSVEELEKRVAQGCVVSLARRPRKDGAGREVVGYEVAERGVFSALGRRNAVAAEIIFSHWAEVVPTCRGQRIHALLFATRDEYFRQRGGGVVCGVVAPRNRASLQALGRAGSAIVGAVERVSLLGGLAVWETPWERIESALRGVDVSRRKQALRPARSMMRLSGAIAKSLAWVGFAWLDK